MKTIQTGMSYKKKHQGKQTNAALKIIKRENIYPVVAPAMGLFLPQALLPNIRLQSAQLPGHGLNPLPEDEIIPFSGVSKSGAGSIIHAGGAGRSVLGAAGVKLQPLTTNGNITLKLINIVLGICQLLRVSRIKRRNVALASLHILNVIFSQF